MEKQIKATANLCKCRDTAIALMLDTDTAIAFIQCYGALFI